MSDYAYTETDKQLQHHVNCWLSETGTSVGQLAEVTRQNATTLRKVLKGNYSSSPTTFLQTMAGAIARFTAHTETAGVPIIPELEITKYVARVCETSRVDRHIGVFTANMGCGKTMAVRQYATSNTGTVLVEADPAMAPPTLLRAILKALGVQASTKSGGSVPVLFRAAVEALNGSDQLLIIDEAECVTDASLEYLRRLHDKAGIGVVLVGTSELQAKLSLPVRGSSQMRSRVGLEPPLVQRNQETDIRTLIEAVLTPLEVEDKASVVQLLVEGSDNNLRHLDRKYFSHLLRAARQNKTITPELVRDIQARLLGRNAPRPRSRGSKSNRVLRRTAA